jgi:hypothetical protein
MVVLEVAPHPGGAELGVLAGDDLGEQRGGGHDDPRDALQGREGRSPLGGLVDVPVEGDGAVGCLVLLGESPLAVEGRGTDLDGRAVGVEASELLGGGQITGLVESLLEPGLEVEHRPVERYGDLQGDTLGGGTDDLRSPGLTPGEGSR